MPRNAAPFARLGLALAVLALLAVAGWRLVAAPDRGQSRGGTVRHPIDPRQQTAMDFGERSHWLQPWRAYLDTPPALRLRDAIGINFNVKPREADATAALLARSGFRRARVELGWDQVRFDDPRRLRSPDRLRALVGALHRYGIRPLILLNANHNSPGPSHRFSAELARRAPEGARAVRLSADAARRIVPGRSGLNAPNGKAADTLFTRVSDDGVAALSKPLSRSLRAGPQPAATLSNAPFGPPRLESGRRNPRFERTLAGWLAYVRTVVGETRSLLGSQAFDVEVWNELGFGSDFLFQERYYDPPRERGKGDVTRELLERTVAMLRDQGSPAPKVGISDGFASQTPFPAGSTSPRGLTALSKHPYYPIRRFPTDATPDAARPLDAPGRDDRRDRFTPRYDAFFPEYSLTGIQTEHLIRDISPITTDVQGTPHGRRTHPAGGRPTSVWVTETNLDPTGADPSDPGAAGGGSIDRLTPRDVAHLYAKAALRYYTSFVNKGVSAVYLFAAKDPSFGLIEPSFFNSLRGSGGPTPAAIGRLARALKGAQAIARPRPLSLLAVSDERGEIQFDGDGTAAHPPLFDRQVTAFFPFQIRPGRYVAAVYVMTRNLAKPYREGSDPRRYDLPEAPFRLTIGGLRGSDLKVAAIDPLGGASVPVKVKVRRRTKVILELPLTDSPRLITLEER